MLLLQPHCLLRSRGAKLLRVRCWGHCHAGSWQTMKCLFHFPFK